MIPNNDIVSILNDKIRTVGESGKVSVLVGPIKLPVDLEGNTVVFQWYSWLSLDEAEQASELGSLDTKTLISKLPSFNLAEKQQSSVLVYGNFAESEEALIRMHSICHTGDIFGSKRCDCGFQLHESMKMIVENGSGALFYLANHEGRGIGLFSKAMAYILQENGLDTVEANLALGFEDDTRSYAEAINVLGALREKPVKLITNNPRKLEALRNAGMNVSDRIPLWGSISTFNEKYIQTKINRAGHFGSVDETVAK